MSITVNQQQATPLKLMVFSIAGYPLGLPLEKVLRVVNAPAELTDDPVSLLPLGQFTISVLNLRSHLRLAYKQSDDARRQEDFLVVTQIETELCAIRVDTPPELIEVSSGSIRQLPAPYRQGHPLSIADRVAVLPQGKATQAIFLLEMKRVIQALSGKSREINRLGS